MMMMMMMMMMIYICTFHPFRPKMVDKSFCWLILVFPVFTSERKTNANITFTIHTVIHVYLKCLSKIADCHTLLT